MSTQYKSAELQLAFLKYYVKSLILVKIFPEILEEYSKYIFIIVAKIQ